MTVKQNKLKPDRANAKLVEELQAVCGRRRVITSARYTLRYRRGFRGQPGNATAVVRPRSLTETWRILQICVQNDAAIIMQAANTGLTGGSTPTQQDYGRPLIVINMMLVDRIDLISGGEQVLCLPGATLYRLEEKLHPLGRQPHSVIGSSCIGASVIGGISNNSGGSLIKRGPAYTELALFAQLDATGRLQLVNELGIDLGTDPHQVLSRIDSNSYSDLVNSRPGRAGSDSEYASHVRDIHAKTPARFNADPRRLNGASGCAGKVAVLAVRLDTFPSEPDETVFCLGSNTTEVFSKLRRTTLSDAPNLPVAAEYMNRDAIDVTRSYGKDTFWAIRLLGTSFMPKLYAWKGRIDGLTLSGPFKSSSMSDRFLQRISKLLPDILPSRMAAHRDLFQHHLLVKTAGSGTAWMRKHLTDLVSADQDISWFETTPEEAKRAFLVRFAVAGAALRRSIVAERNGLPLVALDIALPRNIEDWLEVLPDHLAAGCDAILYYGHFFCHVFHQDYVLKPGVDPEAFKGEILRLLDARGAEYPAEHNVGHAYIAKANLRKFYDHLDPTNSFNPGIGGVSVKKNIGYFHIQE